MPREKSPGKGAFLVKALAEIESFFVERQNQSENSGDHQQEQQQPSQAEVTIHVNPPLLINHHSL